MGKAERQAAYRAYLRSSLWRRKRQKALQRDRYQCVICKSSKKLNVHHLSYPNVFGTEKTRNIITLCSKCHEFVHFGEFEGNITKALRRCIGASDILVRLENEQNRGPLLRALQEHRTKMNALERVYNEEAALLDWI